MFSSCIRNQVILSSVPELVFIMIYHGLALVVVTGVSFTP